MDYYQRIITKKWLNNGKINKSNMNKKQLLAYGLSVFSFDQERFNSWLNSKNKYLEGKKPKELTKTKEGLHLLRTLLDRIEYGNFA